MVVRVMVGWNSFWWCASFEKSVMKDNGYLLIFNVYSHQMTGGWTVNSDHALRNLLSANVARYYKRLSSNPNSF